MFKRFVITLFARFSTIVFNLLISVIVSQYLGEEGRGRQALILLGISLICLFTNLTSGSSIVILVPKYRGKTLLRVSYLWMLIVALPAFGLMRLFSETESYSWHVLFISLIFSAWSSHNNYLLGREKTQWYNTLNFLQTFLLVAYLAFDAWLGRISLQSYIHGLYLSHGVVFLVSIYPLSKNLLPGNDNRKEIARKFVAHGGFIQLANIAQLLNYRFSFYLIGIYMGVAMLGLYSNALALAEGVWLITRSMSVVLFSRIANLDDHTASRKITVQYTWLSILLSAGAMAVLLLVPDHWFTLLFGKDFTGIHPVILWLTPAILALSGSNIISHYFSGTGKNYVNFIGSAIGLAITVIAGYALLSQGLKGIAIASSAAFIATMVFHLVWFYRDGIKEASRYQ